MQTIADTDHAYDIVHLSKTLTLAEFLLHSQEQAAGGIGLDINTDKTVYMCFNQEDISTLNDDSLY